MKTTRYVLALTLFLFSPHHLSASGNDPSIEAKKQLLRDLCTLSIFMKGQAYDLSGAGVVDDLLDQEKTYPIQPSLLYADVSDLEAIYMGKAFINELNIVFDNAHYGSLSGSRLCDLISFGLTGSLLDDSLVRPTYSDISTRVKKEKGIINAQSKDEMKARMEDVLMTYSKYAYKYRIDLLHEYSLNGTEVMDDHLTNGVQYDAYNYPLDLLKINRDQVLQTLRGVNDKARNLLYWSYSDNLYSNPTTLLIWKWHTNALPEVRNLYKDAIEHMSKGTFQQWWKMKPMKY